MIITQATTIPFKQIKKRFNQIKIKANTQELEVDLEEPKTKIIAGSVQNELMRQLKVQAKKLGANAIINFKMKYEMIQDTVTLVLYGVPAVLINEKMFY